MRGHIQKGLSHRLERLGKSVYFFHLPALLLLRRCAIFFATDSNILDCLRAMLALAAIYSREVVLSHADRLGNHQAAPQFFTISLVKQSGEGGLQ